MYVVGGLIDFSKTKTNTIEKLENITATGLQNFNHWQIIQPAEDTLRPRYLSLICPLNDRELIILGGIVLKGRSTGEGWIFDTKTESLRQVIHPDAYSLRFLNGFNYCYMRSHN